MANVPDHNSPDIRELEIKVFEQKYYIVDDEGKAGYRTDYELSKQRIEVLADENGVFLESKENSCSEALSIATPELAVKVAEYIIGVYKKDNENENHSPAPEPGSFQLEEIKFLDPHVQKLIAHELWRLKNHFLSPHGPVDAQGAPELLRHLNELSIYLDIKPAPFYG